MRSFIYDRTLFLALVVLLFIGHFLYVPESNYTLAKAGFSPKLSQAEISHLKTVIAKNEDSVQHRIRLAQHYSNAGEPQKVITFLRPVTEKLKTGGLRLLAKAYGEKKEFLQQIRVLQFLVSQNKNDYISHARLGEAYFSAEKYEKSVESFNQSLKVNKRFRFAYDGLLKALQKVGKRYDIKETLLEMVNLFGQTPELLSEICKVYYEDGFLADAFRYCQLAINKSQSNADNHVHLGLIYEAQGKEARARSIIQRAASNFKNSEFAQYAAADLSEKNNNKFAAYRFYKQGAQSDRQAFRSWLGWARMSFELKKYGESLSAFKRACQLNRTKTVQEFRSSAGRLKVKKEARIWANRFSSEALKCRYKSK